MGDEGLAPLHSACPVGFYVRSGWLFVGDEGLAPLHSADARVGGAFHKEKLPEGGIYFLFPIWSL